MSEMSEIKPINEVNAGRRGLLIAGALSATAVAVPGVTGAAEAVNTAAQAGQVPPVLMHVSLDINGRRHSLEIDTRTSLLDVLREHLHLTGTKKGCDHGQCGACTIMLDGQRINACLTLAVMHDGARVTTIEGLGTPEKLHPMQAAFIAHDGFQCGYCTPGQICSAVAALGEIRQGIPSHVSADLNAPPSVTPEELRERMSGNLCRCGAYSNIIEAISEVAGRPA